MGFFNSLLRRKGTFINIIFDYVKKNIKKIKFRNLICARILLKQKSQLIIIIVYLNQLKLCKIKIAF